MLFAEANISINSIHAQTTAVKDTFQINLINTYKISSVNIIPFSEKVYLSNKLLFKEDYHISYERGTFSLSNHVKFSVADTLVISYESLKINLRTEYKKRSLVINYDEELRDTLRIAQSVSSQLTAESIFGRDIQKSGAIIRGFSVGTNRDFQLNSGLRLQLSGKLSDDISIVAALTDENTPIQPEGNTETLEELDKVFIEIQHKNAVGTFGDYELNERESEFSQITRKLQGLKGEFVFDNHRGIIAVAGSRGKYNTNQYNGSDGNQGPYRLFGVNNERAIIIIAGSERVYLDGEILTRGENNDYTIDYSNAEVTFTPKRLITSASRISIDFEYTDLNYKRNFFGTNYSAKFLENKFNVGVSFYREGDDEGSPIEQSFSDNDLSILKNAGNDRNKAVKSGVFIAQPDSLGNVKGIYSKVDTLINSQPYSYYLYSPGTVAAIYNVSFSFVGTGNGDYYKESLGKYKFVGVGKGSYLPIIYLPLPELKQVGNLSLSASPYKGINLNFELSGSQWDKNRFSVVDDSDNLGYARKLNLDIEPREIAIGDFSFGKVGINYKDRFIQKKYSSLDRIDAVEFNRYYNLSDAQSDDQVLREIGLTLLPFKQLNIKSQYGYLKQGDGFTSDRLLTELKLNEENKYALNYSLDYVETERSAMLSKWNRQNAGASYTFGIVKPGVNFLYENKKEGRTDSLFASSLKYLETSPFVEFLYGSSLNIRAVYSMREESFPLNGIMLKQSTAITKQLQTEFRISQEVSSTINFALRNKNYTDEFKKIGFTNNETILMMTQNRFNFGRGFIQGDLYYQAATEQTARLEKVFLKVPKGTGSYIYLGDLNNNGIPEENEFQLTSYDGEYILVTVPTEELFPVIDLKANTRWKINFDKIAGSAGFLSQALKAISTETFWRIEELSKEQKTGDIYLLKFSKFLNDSTTMRGSHLFQQDLNLFQNASDFSVRLRYIQRKSLNQFSGGLERGYFNEKSLRVRWRLVPEINNQTELIIQTDNLNSPITTGRARTITKNEILSEFSYRPARNVEVGFKIQAARSEDKFPVKTTVADMNSFTLRINYSIMNLGRLRTEIERTELISNTTEANMPFEITRGNIVGKNYFWRVFFDYRIASYIQTSLNYDARLHGNRRVIHSMRAEARAYF